MPFYEHTSEDRCGSKGCPAPRHPGRYVCAEHEHAHYRPGTDCSNRTLWYGPGGKLYWHRCSCPAFVGSLIGIFLIRWRERRELKHLATQ